MTLEEKAAAYDRIVELWKKKENELIYLEEWRDWLLEEGLLPSGESA